MSASAWGHCTLALCGGVHLLGSVGTNAEVGKVDPSDPGLALRAHAQVLGLER